MLSSSSTLIRNVCNNHVVSGVWTLEQKGEQPQVNVTFDNAKPTLTHMALVALENAGMIKFFFLAYLS